MTLNCWSCDHWKPPSDGQIGAEKTGCKIHGEVKIKLLIECNDAQYSPGSDVAEWENAE